MANLKYIGKNIFNHDLIVRKGNVSGSVTSTGSFGQLAAARNATVGNNIVAGNRITADYGTITYSLVVNESGHGGGDFRVESNNNAYQIFSDSNQDKVGIGTNSLTSLLTVNGDITATHVTASGNISASGTIYADNFTSTGGDVGGISFTDDLNITGHITASGDINTTSGRVYEAGTSVIDHATAMAIVFGG